MRWHSTHTWNERRAWNPVAIALSIVGAVVIVFLIAKGEDILVYATGKRLLKEIKAVENSLWEYRELKRFWPGDCDHDGVIGFHPERAVRATTQLSPAIVPMNESCQSEFVEEDQNAPFSDLRMARLWNYGAPNYVAARHTEGGIFQVGSAPDGKYNIIVVYDIPAQLAKMVDVQLDGIENGASGRIRRWDEYATGSAWPIADEPRVALVFYFDQTL